MTAADPFVVTDTERLSTWGSAVQATYYAIEARTRTAWRVAAQWWDELASLHSPTEGNRDPAGSPSTRGSRHRIGG